MASIPKGIVEGLPLTALAPMQDVTDLAFMTVIADCGSPDFFFTEYFRVHCQSTLEKHILPSIADNNTGRPIFAQMIGEDIFHLRRTVKALLDYPVAGIDLNMGCPSPTVYKKNAGGGLLRDPKKVDDILGALRQAIPGLLTVKMRIGFEDTRHFEELLDIIEKRQIDLLSLHARTVKEMYRSEAHYEYIKRAVDRLECPVLANGNVTSAERAIDILEFTGAAGVMIGRHAIRNPWIFRQIRELQEHGRFSRIPLRKVYGYVERLYEATKKPWIEEKAHINKMKKYLNFIGQGVDPEGRFLYLTRRAQSEEDLFGVCEKFLLDGEREFFADEPLDGLVARPNCE